MLIMKPIYLSFVIIQTVMVCSNGQMRPTNWDQGRFGPGTRFFGQGSDTDSNNGRRGFFGNDFGPNQMFPRRPTMGGNDDPGQAPPQIPPTTNPEPTPVGGMGPGSVQNGARPPQPPLGQMEPRMEENPIGAEPEQPQIAPPPPGQMGGAGGRGPGLQIPVNRRAIGGLQPPMSEGPGQMGQGGMGQPRSVEDPEPEPPIQQGSMGQRPGPGQTEYITPQQRPVEIPSQGGVEPRRQSPGVPPEAQPPVNRPPIQPQQPSIPQRPREIGPEERIQPGGQFGGGDVMNGPQFPQGDDSELGRQRRPVGGGQSPNSFRGQPSRPANSYNTRRPTKFQMS